MRDYEGVGIAAPQVYVPQRVFVMEVRSPDPYLGASVFPMTVAVNPDYVPTFVQTSVAQIEQIMGATATNGRQSLFGVMQADKNAK